MKTIPSTLGRIAERTRARVENRKGALPMRALLDRARFAREPHPFVPALRASRPAVIAEIKRASPSAGMIAEGADPVAVAGEYLTAGAAALSVLTEPDFFHGEIGFLERIRARYPQARLLMKDFILDEYQIAEARVSGADSVLLIARLLGDEELMRLFVFARHLRLTPLVEVHDEAELERTRALGATLIGINNRDLDTLKINLDVSRALAGKLPRGPLIVSESGITRGAEVKELSGLGYGAFLVGSSLMQQARPGEALSKLLAEAGVGEVTG